MAAMQAYQRRISQISKALPGLNDRISPLLTLARRAAQQVSILQRGLPEQSPEDTLIKWVRQHGGQADVRLGTPSEGAPRGVLAQRSFAPEEVLISIPQHLAIPFEGTPEEACVLLLHIKHDARKRRQYRPWLDTLPGPEDFIAWDQLDDASLAMLQCPELEDAVRERRRWLEAVWHGRAAKTAGCSEEALLSSQGISMDEVHWAASILRSRNWTVGPAPAGGSLSVMKPLMDMVNHERGSPNRMRYTGDAFQLVHEGDGLAAGEEITFSYEGPQHELRNDQAAIDYSFMLPFAQDSRLFHVDACAAPSAGEDRGELHSWSSEQLEEERAHLEAVLAGLPTSHAEDRRLIASMQQAQGDSPAAELFMVEVRAARKAALHARISDLSAALQ